MNRAIFSIVLSAVLAHSCVAEIVTKTAGPRDFKRLYRAAVDVATTCYGDPGNAVGLVGDTDGSILEELRSNRLIPVVLINGSTYLLRNDDMPKLHSIRVFIIAVRSAEYFNRLLYELRQSIWWNGYASFLFVDTRNEEPDVQCGSIAWFMFVATHNGILNAQFICDFRGSRLNQLLMWNSNPFMQRAPKVWRFFERFDFRSGSDKRDHYLFVRFYEEDGRSCESINFDKTRNVGGYPLRFVITIPTSYLQHDFRLSDSYKKDGVLSTIAKVAEWSNDEHRWFVDNISTAMNATAVISDVLKPPGILFLPFHLSSQIETFRNRAVGVLINLREVPVFAITQHTPHMSQLDKILSVIDRESRIGMLVVYSITFLFFKFFMGQAVAPALLNLVRLTCGSGLTTLPRNVAPTLYLTSLFMFVVTLQAIYTGNLATLLTTTVSYPNVQTRRDIPRLGYRIFIVKGDNTKLTADPILDGCVTEIPRVKTCVEHVLRDRLGVCAMSHNHAIIEADQWKLHISREPILREYTIYTISRPNLLERRVQQVLTTLFETGLHNSETALESLRLQFVDDDEVKKNTERRVMNFEDLRFAMVILGVGLSCSFACFVGEIGVRWLRSKIADRRNRVRTDWGAKNKKFSWFPSFNCRFELRHLFWNRR